MKTPVFMAFSFFVSRSEFNPNRSFHRSPELIESRLKYLVAARGDSGDHRCYGDIHFLQRLRRMLTPLLFLSHLRLQSLQSKFPLIRPLFGRKLQLLKQN